MLAALPEGWRKPAMLALATRTKPKPGPQFEALNLKQIEQRFPQLQGVFQPGQYGKYNQTTKELTVLGDPKNIRTYKTNEYGDLVEIGTQSGMKVAVPGLGFNLSTAMTTMSNISRKRATDPTSITSDDIRKYNEAYGFVQSQHQVSVYLKAIHLLYQEMDRHHLLQLP